jgi:hypothetical protein
LKNKWHLLNSKCHLSDEKCLLIGGYVDVGQISLLGYAFAVSTLFDVQPRYALKDWEMPLNPQRSFCEATI